MLVFPIFILRSFTRTIRYKKGVALDRDYDEDSQKLVDNFAQKLANAIENLVPVASIDFYNDGSHTFNQNLDLRYDYAIGFDETFWTDLDKEENGEDGFSDYFSGSYGFSNDGDIKLTSTALGNGTGSKLKIVSDEVVMNEYTIVVFGDVNGDGYTDGRDAVLLKAYASLMLDPDLTAKYIIYAGDLNFDGNIGNSDVKTVENAGLGKETINQSPEECIGKNITFLDIINGTNS